MNANIVILGATGSIGASALDVIARHPQRFRVIALSAHQRADELARLALRLRPRYACIADPSRAAELRERLRGADFPVRVLAGEEGLVEIASLPEVDCVVAAIVGIAGLCATLAAASAGKKILLANKEALVSAGPVFMRAVQANRATLLPIDSEHNAIFQCLPAPGNGVLPRSGVRRVILTGSGGPFRARARDDLRRVTPEEACAHPSWVMGRKISVDSATMMNKGLEIVEAHWLFGASPEQIEVVVHPQSVVHSMVEYADGSVIAQLANPDMRIPIAQALAYPERIESGAAALDLARIGTLTFERPDPERFPALRLARAALASGGSAPAVLNAANEVAVAAFLEGRLGFLDITAVIEETLAAATLVPLATLEQVLAVDRDARERAARAVQRLGSSAA